MVPLCGSLKYAQNISQSAITWLDLVGLKGFSMVELVSGLNSGKSIFTGGNAPSMGCENPPNYKAFYSRVLGKVKGEASRR
jgi:hypothetical protein